MAKSLHNFLMQMQKADTRKEPNGDMLQERSVYKAGVGQPCVTNRNTTAWRWCINKIIVHSQRSVRYGQVKELNMASNEMGFLSNGGDRITKKEVNRKSFYEKSSTILNKVKRNLIRLKENFCPCQR
ncbi:hypothetical protein CEXT_163171 [Caerostris extrusa]|uniref:Uncharacterized protein n=1 Tax=Caerostris extrusa TaxID=172846 RepID=A0AAV4Y8G0_CAEEX|nr:hypothetical protein CEXT_163171 [Caerostris extrusa]